MNKFFAINSRGFPGFSVYRFLKWLFFIPLKDFD
nr:MAG TPA: hypothetical protein [Caudoviricetes sp.]